MTPFSKTKVLIPYPDYMTIVEAIGNATGGYEALLLNRENEALSTSQRAAIRNILEKLKEAAAIQVAYERVGE